MGGPPVTDERTAALNSARFKIYLRIIPLLFLSYIIAYIDRNNVGLCSVNMSKDMPIFDDQVFGFGMGIFFWGYFLLEIPGSIIVERWSARKWICRIMVTWGLIAAMTAFVTKPWHFYTIRFLLGLAEAGFFPGVIVYLTHWFPAKDRARAISTFLIASPIAMMLGSGISSLVLPIGTTVEKVVTPATETSPAIMETVATYEPLFGLVGWQWVFIMWGIPAVILGLVVLLWLPDRPRHAKWLTQSERDALEESLAAGKVEPSSSHHHSALAGLSSLRVWMLAFAYFGVVTGNYGIELFLPRIIKDWYKLDAATIGLLMMIPHIPVICGQLFNGWSSDHFHERHWHSIAPIVIGAVAMVFAPMTQGSLILTMICFTIASAGMKSYMPAFWSLPSMFLKASAAAASVGLINSLGNIGGFVGPYVLGSSKGQTASFDFGIYYIACSCIVSASIIFLMRLMSPPKPQ